MMKLIAIETATENCSVALLSEGQISQKQAEEPRKHAELVLPYLDELLQRSGVQKKDIEGIVFGNGPGAFTGVRIAIGVVQGLALALDVPVLGVSTLRNMAQGAWQAGIRGELLVANDARMNEVYWASFELSDAGIDQKQGDQLAAPDDLPLSGFDHAMGNAFKTFPELIEKASMTCDAEALPNAKNLLLMAHNDFNDQAMAVHEIEPNYVRHQVVRS
ncbi:tRNA (adenosine(37)-N6)-threonylcarbamoyltransferase complex dimerization subunit type 1 TsaB [Marinicella rhabdoformis]|uniref:tRNA (adenosine(37)-N6)-threonylcarbamoyltransferase complex dimerization subunit type 1 TsaB n=1 Tax=Marinicella rhabdoformis TaxID=2580566 RepID=UPI0012AEBD52|nr:tRNA (adenosine(37)-N6)-threonylcarbamoyltransferase complex dimerization subunit type 1 TsaB [Marinicella rhabdoformis]